MTSKCFQFYLVEYNLSKPKKCIYHHTLASTLVIIKIVWICVCVYLCVGNFLSAFLQLACHVSHWAFHCCSPTLPTQYLLLIVSLSFLFLFNWSHHTTLSGGYFAYFHYFLFFLVYSFINVYMYICIISFILSPPFSDILLSKFFSDFMYFSASLHSIRLAGMSMDGKFFSWTRSTYQWLHHWELYLPLPTETMNCI